METDKVAFRLTSRVGKNTIPLLYIERNDIRSENIIFFVDYSGIIPENVTTNILNPVDVKAIPINTSQPKLAMLSIKNISRDVLITNQYFFDPYTLRRKPLWYNVKITTKPFQLNTLNIIRKIREFSIGINDNEPKSAMSPMSEYEIPIHDPLNTVLVNISFNNEIVDVNYYSIDYSNMTIYISNEYFESLRNRNINNINEVLFRLTYNASRNVLQILNKKEGYSYRISIEYNYSYYIYSIYTDYPYSLEIQFKNENTVRKVKPSPIFRHKEGLFLTKNEFVIENENIMILDDENNYIRNYSIVSTKNKNTLISLFAPKGKKPDITHWYMLVSSGIFKRIDRKYDSNDPNETMIYTYNINNNTNSISSNYIVTVQEIPVIIDSYRIQLSNSNIIFDYNDDYSINGIEVIADNQRIEVKNIDEANSIITLKKQINIASSIKVTYSYEIKMLPVKNVCINPSSLHDYHNNDINNKVVVFFILPDEILIQDAPTKIFAIYLTRFTESSDITYSYDTLRSIITDPQKLFSRNQNGSFVYLPNTILIDSLINGEETLNQLTYVPAIILGTIKMYSRFDPLLMKIKDIRRKVKKSCKHNECILDNYYGGGIIDNTNRYTLVEVDNELLDDLSIKLYGKHINDLTSDEMAKLEHNILTTTEKYITPDKTIILKKI